MKTVIKILISVVLLGFIISKINFHELKAVLANFNPFFYLCSICILSVHQYIWATAWRLTLGEKKINMRTRDIYRAVLTSYFFGTFLPSAAGPDIMLAFNLGKSMPEKQHAPGSLFFIRMMNIACILLTSGIVLFFLPNKFFIRQILRLTWFLLFLVWTFYWIAVHPKSRIFMEKILNKYRFLKFIYKIFHSFSEFGQDNKVILKVWLLGLAMAFLKVMIDYSIALSLGIHIPYLWFLGLVPSISIISLLPISIAGLGLREGAYIGIFSAMGVPPAQSLSISLVLFTFNIWLCAIGGTLYLLHGTHVKSNFQNRRN